jgi:hypothetical protein
MEAQKMARTLIDLDTLATRRADMNALSLATGLRAANVTGLQCTQLALVRKVA